jgi:hypothetical protein
VVGATGEFRQTSSDAGILTFNGDGTGSAEGSFSTMDVTATGVAIISVSEFTASFDYTVNSDGSVDMTMHTYPFEGVAGRGVGDPGTVSGHIERYQISHGNSMLIGARRASFTVETVAFTLRPASPRYRICVRSTTATKLPGG